MPDWGFLLLPVCLLAFVVSATCGFGGRLVLVPVLALWLGAPTAVALSSPVLTLNSLGKCVLLWRDIDWRRAGWMLLGAVPGAYLGASALAALPADLAPRVIGVLLLLGVAVTLANRVRWPRLPAPALAAAGLAAGAASGVAGAGGPTRAVTLRGAGLSRAPLVATSAVVDIAMAAVNIPIYIQAGFIQPEHILIVVPLAITAWIGIAIGRTLLHRITEPTYRIVFAAALSVACIRMAL
jgi:uncharacterized protein